MSAKGGLSSSQDQQPGGITDPRKKYDELLRLKNILQLPEANQDPADRLAKIQRLRNESQELRLHLSPGSSNPSTEDLNRLHMWSSNLLQDIAKDPRSPSLSTSSQASKSFQTPTINRTRTSFAPAESESEKLAEQNRITNELKDILDKRFDRFETTVNSRLDRFESSLASHGSRIERFESNLTALQSGFTRSEDNNSRHFARMEDQYSALSKKISDNDDRQNRRIDDLMKERQSSGSLIPPVVHLNVTGLLPQMGGMQVSSAQPIAVSAQSENGVRGNLPDVAQQPVFSEFPPKPAPASSQQPLTVNVPKTKSHLDQLSGAPVCSPSASSSGENKPSTISWGAKPLQPSKAEEPESTPKQPEVKLVPAQPSVPEVKPAAFSGFSGFGTPSKGFGDVTAPASSGPFSGLFSGGGAGPGALSFSALATGTTASPAGFSKDPKGFAGSGTKLFSGASTTVKKTEDEDEEGGDEGGADEQYEPKVDFQPLVSLPEVKVTTGEEEYEVVFKDRAKLYRFDNTTKEWKERGLGDMTLQRKTDETTGRISARVLMRWEKTLKICANHSITAEMSLVRKTETDKTTWRWFANDFADGEVKLESFTIKFKTKEQADLFKKSFDDLQMQVAKQGATPVKIPPKSAKTESEEPKSLSELFKPKAGVWACGGCYVNNDANKTSCVACGTPKPGSAARSEPGGGFSFGKKAEAAAPFSFGYQSASQPLTTEVKPFSGFAAGVPATGFSFGTPVKDTTQPKPAPQGSAGGFAFGSVPSSGGFKFDLGQAAAESSPKRQDDEDGGEDDVEAERHDLIFEPVVQLPDKVDLKTGEENEVELYCQRAKLYRFDQGEWKERGLGDIRMMKDRNSAKIRLLMRREKILKVCCNHLIRADMMLKPMPNTKNTLIWEAVDFSEGVSEHQLLGLRFKHEAHAKEFKDLFERAQRIIDGKENANVEKFPRVQVDEGETLAPIAESGKKAIEMMSVKNPFENAAKSSPVSGAEEVKLRQTIIGDEVYKHFGVIYDQIGKVAAVFVPAIGFLHLNNQNDLGALIAAGAKGEDVLKNLLPKLTTPINLQDFKSIPDAVRRYVRASKVKEIFESEMWAIPIFEQEASLSRKVEEGNWENLNPGVLRLMPHDYDQPCSIQYDTGVEEEAVFHCIAGDADLKVNHLRRTFEWKAMEESFEEKALCTYKAVLKDQKASERFERLMKEAISAAEQQDVWNEEDASAGDSA